MVFPSTQTSISPCSKNEEAALKSCLPKAHSASQVFLEELRSPTWALVRVHPAMVKSIESQETTPSSEIEEPSMRRTNTPI
jgi:hypothetical protein